MWVARFENGEEVREFENGVRLPFPNDFISGFKFAPYMIEVEKNGLVKINGMDLYFHLEIDGKSYPLLNVEGFNPFYRYNGAVGMRGDGMTTSVSMGYDAYCIINQKKINIHLEIEQEKRLLLKHILMCDQAIDGKLHCYFDKKISLAIRANANEEVVTVKTLL